VADLVRKILKVFANNNLFEEGIELIGSWCFKLYQRHLGVERFPLSTPDVDFLIPRPFQGKRHSGFIKQLEELGFRVDFNSDGSLYLWNAELKIEFLTAEKSAGSDRAVKIKNLGIDALPIRHVGFLLDKPLMITDKRIKIKVPSPARFCLHKLIIASRRKDVGKRLKDLEQAIYTSVIVDKKEMQATFRSLPEKWQKTISRTLGGAGTVLPLQKAEIDNLKFTLQSAK
jgi:hypothetical protein